MYITNLTHSLNEQGEIAKEMPKAGRERASYSALIVDIATKDYEPPIMATEIRCMKKQCKGMIELTIHPEDEVIEWWCTDCDEMGQISGWQGTKWDNRR